LVPAVAAKGGFEPVESGPLSNARFLEPVGELNILVRCLPWLGHLGGPGLD
jgi:predicted dinucleotide-binding enzyme